MKFRKHYPKNSKVTLRDFLAIDRTRMANQRTLLSFLRTSLYLLVSGLAVEEIEFLQSMSYLSRVAFILAPIVSLIGLINYLMVRKRVDNSYKVD
ncbi:MAG: DUF202 domain-containing protein [Bacteroidota bacterium]